MLTDFQILDGDAFNLHRFVGAGRGASLWCFDKKQPVIVFIEPEAIQARFGRELPRAEANVAIQRDLRPLRLLIAQKYRDLLWRWHEVAGSGQAYPLIEIRTSDIMRSGLAPDRGQRKQHSA